LIPDLLLSALNQSHCPQGLSFITVNLSPPAISLPADITSTSTFFKQTHAEGLKNVWVRQDSESR